ncbi:MAG: hypothetical protein HY928_06280 [Elusimicrobia bacterium]|nr:hypothetical protein [Elusimicrobiota bacterium]
MRRALALALLLLPTAACRREHPCMFTMRRYDALPILRPVPKDATLELRVLYLEDGRVPGLGARGRTALYARVERLAKRWLGYRIKLREVGARDLRAEFARPDIAFRRPAEAACIAAVTFDPTTDGGGSVAAALVSREFDARGPQVFARLFPETLGMSPAAAKADALRRFLSLHKALSGIRTKEGPLLRDPDDSAMYSFMHWAHYIKSITEADFVLTNAAFLVPDDDMPVYVLARGGLTTGFVDNNPQAPFGGAGAVTLLPFLSGETLLDPSAQPTSEAENLDAAATMWIHEVGHLLGRYGEMYGESGCVHVASEGLKYFAWHRAIAKAGNRCSRPPAILPKF